MNIDPDRYPLVGHIGQQMNAMNSLYKTLDPKIKIAEGKQRPFH